MMRPKYVPPTLTEKGLDSLILWAEGVPEDRLHSMPAKQVIQICTLAKEALLKRIDVTEETSG